MISCGHRFEQQPCTTTWFVGRDGRTPVVPTRRTRIQLDARRGMNCISRGTNLTPSVYGWYVYRIRMARRMGDDERGRTPSLRCSYNILRSGENSLSYTYLTAIRQWFGGEGTESPGFPIDLFDKRHTKRLHVCLQLIITYKYYLIATGMRWIFFLKNSCLNKWKTKIYNCRRLYLGRNAEFIRLNNRIKLPNIPNKFLEVVTYLNRLGGAIRYCIIYSIIRVRPVNNSENNLAVGIYHRTESLYPFWGIIGIEYGDGDDAGKTAFKLTEEDLDRRPPPLRSSVPKLKF